MVKLNNPKCRECKKELKDGVGRYNDHLIDKTKKGPICSDCNKSVLPKQAKAYKEYFEVHNAVIVKDLEEIIYLLNKLIDKLI